MKSGFLSVNPMGSPNCPSVMILEDERPMFKCLNNVIRDSLHSKHSTRINPSLCRGLVRALGIEKFREVPLPTLETTNAGGDAKPSLPRKMDITF